MLQAHRVAANGFGLGLFHLLDPSHQQREHPLDTGRAAFSIFGLFVHHRAIFVEPRNAESLGVGSAKLRLSRGFLREIDTEELEC
jgi:hypothetical protein